MAWWVELSTPGLSVWAAPAHRSTWATGQLLSLLLLSLGAHRVYPGPPAVTDWAGVVSSLWEGKKDRL